MTGIFVVPLNGDLGATLDLMDKATQDWTMQAARGECAWICSDCCCTFPDGMPDACAHGHQRCTEIIKRDKAVANGATANFPSGSMGEYVEGE